MKPLERDHHAAQLSVGFHAKPANLTCIVSTRAPAHPPARPPAHSQPSGNIGQPMHDSLYHRRKSSMRLCVCAHLKSCARSIAGQGLSHGSIFI